MAAALSLPKGLPTNRYRPKPPVALPAGLDELPLMDAKTPPEKRIQEHWIARVNVFDLSDREQLAQYEHIWQKICDGLYVLCEQRTEFTPESARFVTLLRWAELEYKVPSQE